METTNSAHKDDARWPCDYRLDPACGANGSDLCWKFANHGGCENCYLRAMKEVEAQEAACSQWDKTVRLLPTDIDRLSQSETSWFSVGPDKEPTDGYAVLDMANPEPYATKGLFFGYGKKIRTPVGSLVTLHIAIGKRGIRAFRALEWIRLGWLIGLIALAFVLLAIPQISRPMVELFILLPAIFLALMVAAGYAIGKSLAAVYMKRHANEINFDVTSIPLINEMLRRGWYFFQADHGRPRMTFTRKHSFGPLLPPRQSDMNIDTD